MRLAIHPLLGSLSVLLFLVVASACRDDDPPEPAPGWPSAALFAPYSPGNYWVYERVFVDLSTGIETTNMGNDSIWIDRDSTVGEFTFHLLRGTIMGLPMDRWYAADGPNLVDLNGKVFMSTDTNELAGSWSYSHTDNPFLDSVYRTLRHVSESVATPAGSFLSSHQFDQVLYMPDVVGYRPLPAVERNHYAEGIGVVQYKTMFASSPTDVELRLLRYHVE